MSKLFVKLVNLEKNNPFLQFSFAFKYFSIDCKRQKYEILVLLKKNVLSVILYKGGGRGGIGRRARFRL